MPRKILVVVDMQKDFVDGSLGTPEAEAIVPAVVAKVAHYAMDDLYATLDTHPANYLATQEGHFLPVEHCIKSTAGWQLIDELQGSIPEEHIFEKPSFGSLELARALSDLNAGAPDGIEIELVGLCTDICVVSNALVLKAFMPEVPISVDAACCAGVTPAKHEAALETMRSCQIMIENAS